VFGAAVFGSACKASSAAKCTAAIELAVGGAGSSIAGASEDMSRFEEDRRFSNLGEDTGESELRIEAMEVRRPRAGDEARRSTLMELEQRRSGEGEGRWTPGAGEEDW
jgi:hypothetical protein